MKYLIKACVGPAFYSRDNQVTSDEALFSPKWLALIRKINLIAKCFLSQAGWKILSSYTRAFYVIAIVIPNDKPILVNLYFVLQ